MTKYIETLIPRGEKLHRVLTTLGDELTPGIIASKMNQQTFDDGKEYNIIDITPEEAAALTCGCCGKKVLQDTSQNTVVFSGAH